jgi:catechol 2,3-dioxygenase-like lactoylglutathione lyase family enzyme
MPIAFRYIVNNVDEALPFYTELLGFKVDMHPAPPFAAISKDGLTVFLNQPGAGGAGQSLPDGSVPAPGGWNRLQVTVDDLDSFVGKVKEAGYRLRSEIIQGNGGRQVIAEDPSGNPVELFEPPSR